MKWIQKSAVALALTGALVGGGTALAFAADDSSTTTTTPSADTSTGSASTDQSTSDSGTTDAPADAPADAPRTGTARTCNNAPPHTQHACVARLPVPPAGSRAASRSRDDGKVRCTMFRRQTPRGRSPPAPVARRVVAAAASTFGALPAAGRRRVIVGRHDALRVARRHRDLRLGGHVVRRRRLPHDRVGAEAGRRRRHRRRVRRHLCGARHGLQGGHAPGRRQPRDRRHLVQRGGADHRRRRHRHRPHHHERDGSGHLRHATSPTSPSPTTSSSTTTWASAARARTSTARRRTSCPTAARASTCRASPTPASRATRSATTRAASWCPTSSARPTTT